MNRTVETRCIGPSKFPYSFSFAPRLDSARILNDVQAVRVVDPLRKRVQVTLISVLPFVLGSH
jgi:hypothetical protein